MSYWRKSAAALRSARGGSAQRLLLDIIIIFGVAVVIRLVTFPLDLFEQLAEFSRDHEEWELDELLVTAAILSIALIAFGIRRVQDQYRELKLRRAAEHRATLLARQDPLTGLPNRRGFQEALGGLSADATHALFIIDLDGFKPVNDMYGHATGDESLRVIAQRLKTVGDSRALAARLGGDEFALLVRNLASRDEPERIAHSIIAAIEIPVTAGGLEHRLEASVGVTLIEAGARLSEEHMRRADVALYRAKERPSSAYCLYNESMDTALRERIQLEKELRAALAADQIVPHYQPIVDLKTGEILKFEALARWTHPTLGEIPPARFIEVAEERGLIVDLTEQIVRRACRDALTWPESIVLALNISPLLLESSTFSLRLVNALAETGLPPRRVEVEITERALETASHRAREFLDGMRTIGVRIAIDDFGTGYSNLSRLRELPFDEIKIDSSFVQSLAENTNSSVIVRAMVELGRGLGLTVTAEGVEDPDQRSELIAQGCEQGQGYLFSRALPADEATQLVVERARVAAGQ
jgi:diguanylate cyclase (GGDEF)-like protein